MITLPYQVNETKRIQIKHLINSGSTPEQAFETHGVSIDLKDAVLNPPKKQVVPQGCFDVDGYCKKNKKSTGY